MGDYAELNRTLGSLYRTERKRLSATGAVDGLVHQVLSALKNTIGYEIDDLGLHSERLVDALIEDALTPARREAFIEEQDRKID